MTGEFDREKQVWMLLDDGTLSLSCFDRQKIEKNEYQYGRVLVCNSVSYLARIVNQVVHLTEKISGTKMSDTKDLPPYLWYNAVYHDSTTVILDVRDPCEYILRRLKPGVFLIASWSQTIEDPVAEVIRILSLVPDHYDVATHVYFMVNSPVEYDALAPFHEFLHVRSWSNACRTFADNADEFMQQFTMAGPLAQRPYQAVMLSRNTKFKRHELTFDIPRLLYVIPQDKFPANKACACKPLTSALEDDDKPMEICKTCQWNAIPVTDIQQRMHAQSALRLDQNHRQVRQAMYQSQCGLILSASEGACYSSLEYLLHGLPVISTHSTGGRDNYYDDSNHVICQPTRNGVRKALEKVQRRCQSGRFDPVQIRRRAIKQFHAYRDMYIHVIQEIFTHQHVDEDAFSYFERVIKHNFIPPMRPYSDKEVHVLNSVLDKCNTTSATRAMLDISSKASRTWVVPARHIVRRSLQWVLIPVQYQWNDKTGGNWEHSEQIRTAFLQQHGTWLDTHGVARDTYQRRLRLAKQQQPGQQEQDGQKLVPIYFQGLRFPTPASDIVGDKFALLGTFAIQTLTPSKQGKVASWTLPMRDTPASYSVSSLFPL
jgi:glycosyltransferase involved in cell wall biosynthesis